MAKRRSKKGRAAGRAGPAAGRASAPPAGKADAQGPAATQATAATATGPEADAPTWRRHALLVGCAALVCAALAVRVAPTWSQVFPRTGEVRLLGTDSYYHLRHSRAAARHFPHLQRWDIGTHYPTGRRSPTAGLYDLALALCALAASGVSDLERASLLVAAWAGPLGGAAGLVLLMLLAGALRDRWQALLAGLALTLFPGHFLSRTLLGNADHHGVEVLLVLAALLGLAKLLRAERERERPWWRPAPVAAMPLALLFFTWAGAPLYLVLVGAALLGLAALLLASGAESRWLGRAALRYGAGFVVVVAPCALLLPDWVLVRGVLVETLALAVGVGLGIPAYVWAGRLLSRRVPPVAAALGLLLAVALAAGALAVLLPQGGALLQVLVGAKGTTISEQRVVTLARFLDLLGPVGLLALCAPVAAVVVALRRLEDPVALVPILVATGIGALWVSTHDYDYAVPPLAAISAAYLARWLLSAARAGRHALVAGSAAAPPGVEVDRRARRRVAVAALLLALVSLVPLWPLRLVRSPLLQREQVASGQVLDDGWGEALRWMAHSTPQPTLPIDALVEPFGDDFQYPPGSYGIMTAWDYGSLIAALGRRPPAMSQGQSADTARWLVSPDEATSLERLAAPCRGDERFRYVALGALTLGDHFIAKLLVAGEKPGSYMGLQRVSSQGGAPVDVIAFGARYYDTIAARLFLRAGDGLSHYRLVFQSAHQSYIANWLRPAPRGAVSVVRGAVPLDTESEQASYRRLATAQGVVQTPRGRAFGGAVLPSVRIFEVVPGATLSGSAPPGTVVEARLELESAADGARLTYRCSARAGADGRVALTVPYATTGDTASSVRARGPMQLLVTAPGAPAPRLHAQLDIGEDQVQRGARIELGALGAARQRPGDA